MLNQILLIHLYRPFLRYTKGTTPLPSHVSPRKICTQAASSISKLMRMYKRTYGLKQICNIVVYIAHTACTIHLLNLPGRNPERDVVHGLRNIEEMADGWLAARRTLRILDISANKWQVPLPAEATAIFERALAKWGSWGSWDQATSPSSSEEYPSPTANIANVTNPGTSPMPFSSFRPIPVAQPVTTVPLAPSQWSKPTGPELAHHDPTIGQPSQVPNYRVPDTSYLSSIPQVRARYENTLTGASGPPSSTQPTWFQTTAPQVQPQTAMSPTSIDSPASGLDGTENYVEESQDWWNQNAAAGLDMGMNSWGAVWPMAGMPTQPSSVPFTNTPNPLMSMSPQPGVSVPRHPQGTMGAPNMASTTQGGTPEYDNRWQ